MTAAATLVMCLAVVVSPGRALVFAGQPIGAAASVAEQVEAVPLYARVAIRLADGRTLEGYLVSKSDGQIAIRPGKGTGAPQVVRVSAIGSIHVKPEDRGLSRGRRFALVVAVGAAVAVVAWVWAVKSRAFGT